MLAKKKGNYHFFRPCETKLVNREVKCFVFLNNEKSILPALALTFKAKFKLLGDIFFLKIRVKLLCQ